MKPTLHLLRCARAPLPRFTAVRSALTSQRCVAAALACPSRACSCSGKAPQPPSSRADARHTIGTEHSTSACVAHPPKGEEDEDEEDLQVTLYRPTLTPEQAERRAKTDVFLCLLLTLPRAQDWRDMLAAALRAATWRPHHLNAVLRGVQLSKYNEPAAYVRSCAGGGAHARPARVSSPAASLPDALRAAIADAAATAPRTSTPTARLRRARAVLVFCAEEGPVYASVTPDAAGADVTAPGSGYAPSAEAVHHLLALLLQAAQRSSGADASAFRGLHGHPEALETVPDAGALPVATFHEVWHFLAWMELHGYHVLSTAVLDALEATVDEGFTSPASAAPASSASGAPPPPQYAVVSQRVHRLEYLRGERARLRETVSGGDSPAGATAPHFHRCASTPRTSPNETD